MPHKHTIKGKWTGQWLGQVKRHGKRIRKIFSTKAEALAWEVEAKKQAPVPKTVTVYLIDWLNQYLDYAESRYSPKTYGEKKNVVKQFLATFGKNTAVETIKPGMVLEYLQRHFQSRSGHAANKERKNLMAAWNYGYCFIEGFPMVNPIRKIPKFPEIPQARYVPPEDDFWKVIGVAQGQDRVLLLTFLHTAGRRGEVYRLQWSDVDFDRQQVRLTTRKRKDGSQEADWVPMTDELHHAIWKHQQSRVSDWVFPQIEGRHRGKPYTEKRGFPQALCQVAGVQSFGCHAIRHLTASILAKHNTPMVVIQQILRHRRLATTEHYVRGLEPVRPHLKVLEGGLFRERSNDGAKNDGAKIERGSRGANS